MFFLCLHFTCNKATNNNKWQSTSPHPTRPSTWSKENPSRYIIVILYLLILCLFLNHWLLSQHFFSLYLVKMLISIIKGVRGTNPNRGEETRASVGIPTQIRVENYSRAIGPGWIWFWSKTWWDLHVARCWCCWSVCSWSFSLSLSLSFLSFFLLLLLLWNVGINKSSQAHQAIGWWHDQGGIRGGCEQEDLRPSSHHRGNWRMFFLTFTFAFTSTFTFFFFLIYSHIFHWFNHYQHHYNNHLLYMYLRVPLVQRTLGHQRRRVLGWVRNRQGWKQLWCWLGWWQKPIG